MCTRAKKSLGDECVEQRIYDHWFALLLYDTYLSAKSQLVDDSNMIKFRMDNFSCEIEHSSLHRAATAIEFAASLQHLGEKANERGRGVMASHNLRSQEVTYSCLYARALDRFIFEKDFGAVLHQGPSRKQPGNMRNPEQADIYIVPMKDGYKPGSPIMQMDVKLNSKEFDIADRESTLYSMNGVHVNFECSTWPVLLGMPRTPEYVQFQVHVPVNRKMWKMTICEGAPYDKALLCTLYAAVHYLCQQPIIRRDPPDSPMPFKQSEDYSALKEGDCCRIFVNRSTNTVHKIYDTRRENQQPISPYEPNLELIKSTGALSGVVQESLTTDKRFCQLKYQYIEGSNVPMKLKQFVGVTHVLHKVHELGFVHGDIRLANIVFSTEDDKSYLIDFDLAREEGKGRYPEGYNNLSMRHKGACARQYMKKEHDRFSLAEVMKEAVIPATEDDRKRAQQIFKKVNDLKVSLQTIASLLSNIDF